MAYLDHAATTAIRPEALAVWQETAVRMGNPSSSHRAGRAARKVVEESRERIAADLRVPPECVTFTSGGTESDNIGVVGGFRAVGGRSTVVLPRIEHKAVLEPAETLVRAGARVVWLDAGREGVVTVDRVNEALGDDVALVALMWANNEVGTVQPVAEVAQECAARGIRLHTDAVQAAGNVPLQLADVTTAALSAHKFGGPMGVGLLVKARGADLVPITSGGGQEYGVRPGTLNVPGIAATAIALTLAITDQAQHALRVAALRDRLVDGIVLIAAAEGIELTRNHRPDGLPGLASLTFTGCRSDDLTMLLDVEGVCASGGSACSSGVPRPSYVLQAMGRADEEASGTLRISLGWNSTVQDVDTALAAFPRVLGRIRAAVGAR